MRMTNDQLHIRALSRRRPRRRQNRRADDRCQPFHSFIVITFSLSMFSIILSYTTRQKDATFPQRSSAFSRDFTDCLPIFDKQKNPVGHLQMTDRIVVLFRQDFFQLLLEGREQIGFVAAAHNLALAEDEPAPFPPAMPRSASFASPGPLTTQPMTAILRGRSMFWQRVSTASARLARSICVRPQVGQLTMSTPLP